MSARTRDDRWDAGGLYDAAYADFLVERGHRVVCAEAREWWGGHSRAEKIARDARKAQIIAWLRTRERRSQ